MKIEGKNEQKEGEIACERERMRKINKERGGMRKMKKEIVRTQGERVGRARQLNCKTVEFGSRY